MKRLIARVCLTLLGWKELPNHVTLKKFVLVAAPHTSNWDLPIMLCIGWLYGMNIGWIGKKQIFRFPFGGIMRWLGGISVDRSQRNNLVAYMAKVFAGADRLIVAFPPEGTRGRAEYWKSGFYHVARGAGVPIVLGVLDYKTRRGGFGPVIDSSLPAKEVMDQAREFYKDKVGKFPENFAVPRLKEEESGTQKASA